MRTASSAFMDSGLLNLPVPTSNRESKVRSPMVSALVWFGLMAVVTIMISRRAQGTSIRKGATEAMIRFALGFIPRSLSAYPGLQVASSVKMVAADLRAAI